MTPVYPRIQLWLDLSTALATAAEAGARRARMALHRRPKGGYLTRRPGHDSPMWNVCATLVRESLKRHGAKTQLARYLGVPKQRVHDFLTGKSRLPDAELTLRLLHWLAETRSGRDPSL